MQLTQNRVEENQLRPSNVASDINMSDRWRAAFGNLTAGCLSKSRAVIVLGEKGIGKSALISEWVSKSKGTFNIISLDNAQGEPDQVVASLAEQMGVDTADLGRSAILNAIKLRVSKMREKGRETVVILGDADAIPPNTIELLMILARDHNSDVPVMRYVLSGTEQLRKNMRLDGGATKRHNYTIVQMDSFSQAQSIEFANGALARSSKLRLSDDAGKTLHNMTSGVPGRILSVLDRLSGSLDAGEAEISAAQVKAAFSAADPVNTDGSTAKTNVQAGNQASETADASSQTSPEHGPKRHSISEHKPRFADDAQELAKQIGGNHELPSSIGAGDDPRPMLRWAFGLNQHSETEALTNRAAQTAARTSRTRNANAHLPEDVNEAIAQVAAREAAEKMQAVAPEQQPQAVESKNATIPNALDNMIASEGFTFTEQDRAAERIVPVQNPDQLKSALKDVPLETKPRKSRKGMFAVGALALSAGIVGILWTKLTEVPTLRAPTGDTTSVVASAPQATAPVQTPTPSASNGSGNAAAGAIDATNAPAIEIVADAGPDLSVAIDLLKLPNAPQTDAALAGFPATERAISFQNADYLSPANSSQSQQAQEMAKITLALETDRLFSELQSKVQSKEAEIASAQKKLADVQAQALKMSGLIASQQEQIETNETLLNSAKTAALDTQVDEAQGRLDALLAKVKQEQDALSVLTASREDAKSELSSLSAAIEASNSKMQALEVSLSEAQASLSTSTAELAELEQRKETLGSDVGALERRLSEGRSEMLLLENDLKALNTAKADGDAELNRLNTAIADAGGAVESAQTRLEEANAALADRQQSLAALSTQTSQAQASLDELNAKMAEQSGALQNAQEQLAALSETSDTLVSEREAKQADLERVVAQIEETKAAVAAQESKLATLRQQETAVISEQAKAGENAQEQQNALALANTELASLSEQRNNVVDELNQVESETAALRDEQDKAAKRLAVLTAEFDQKNSRLETLNLRIDASTDELAAITSRKDRVNEEIAVLTNEGTALLRDQQLELDRVQSELDRKRAALRAVNEELENKQQALDNSTVVAALAPSQDPMQKTVVPAVRKTISPPTASTSTPAPAPEVETPVVASVSPQVPEAVTPPAADTSSVQARDAEMVAEALSDAPGLSRVPQAKKDELQAALVRGECVTDALKATFGRVNPHTLVALLENMEMCGS